MPGSLVSAAGALNVFGLAFCGFLYLKGRYFPPRPRLHTVARRRGAPAPGTYRAARKALRPPQAPMAARPATRKLVAGSGCPLSSLPSGQVAILSLCLPQVGVRVPHHPLRVLLAHRQPTQVRCQRGGH